MKKITKKLSSKYVKLHKSRLQQDGSMKSEDGGMLFHENHSPENEENNETKETPKVTKIMESMHRKLMLKEKADKKYTHVDDQEHSHKSERSVRNGGRDNKDDQLEGSVRNNHMDHLEDLIRGGRDRMDHTKGSIKKGGRDSKDDQVEGSVRNMNRGDMDQFEGSVRNSHMDHLEDLIRGGRDRVDHTEGSSKKGGRDRVDQLGESSKNGQNVTPKTSGQVDQSEESTKNPSDFASKKDYLDWIEYVEGSSHHCFDRSEKSENPYRKDDIDHDQIGVGISEGSIEGNDDEILLLKSSKYRKMKSEDSKGYKKGKGRKVKDSLKSQMVD